MKKYIPAMVTLLLLGALTAESLSRPKPQDAEPYHQHVFRVCQTIPKVIDDWVGQDLPAKPAAVALLKPNFMLHRRYVNRDTGASVDFLVVQCRDARDMAGHYPPVCYPAHGWQAVSATPAEWQAAGRTIHGMDYEFTVLKEGQSISRRVANLLILPSGRLVRDMNEIRAAAADYLRQFYGAAQIQVVVDAGVSPEERRRIVTLFLEANVPVLQALSDGEKK